jgi:hypothetical protein
MMRLWRFFIRCVRGECETVASIQVQRVALNLFREMFKSNLQLFAKRTSCMGYLGDQENHLL